MTSCQLPAALRTALAILTASTTSLLRTLAPARKRLRIQHFLLQHRKMPHRQTPQRRWRPFNGCMFSFHTSCPSARVSAARQSFVPPAVP